MVDDRINQIQMARGMARIGEKLTLMLVSNSVVSLVFVSSELSQSQIATK